MTATPIVAHSRGLRFAGCASGAAPGSVRSPAGGGSVASITDRRGRMGPARTLGGRGRGGGRLRLVLRGRRAAARAVPAAASAAAPTPAPKAEADEALVPKSKDAVAAAGS
jgi:hypothetical protein